MKTKAARAYRTGPAGAVEAEEPFIPLHSLQQVLRFWWFVFLLMMVGALFGYLMHRARPPLYEAVGGFTTSIDFVSTGPMTQFEEDITIDAVGALINSSAIRDEVLARAAQEDILISPVELGEAVQFGRKVSDWEVRLRMADPRSAERIASLWVELGQSALLESSEHAQRAEQHQRTLRALENCLQQAAASEPVSAQCSGTRLAEIQADLQMVGQQYTDALLASRGISPALRIGPSRPAQVSPGPVIFGRGQLILAGGFLGFLLGVVMVPFGFPARWMKRT